MGKLDKSTYPGGIAPTNFKCHGPVATKDTEFEGCRMADLGCFKQEGVDSNKYYHCAVVSANGTWYLYKEWGRVGKANQFQFEEYNNEQAAMAAFVKQCQEKNTKRGEWGDVGGSRMFIPKKNKKGEMEDLYSVRQFVSRDVGLPDARNISVDGGAPAKPKATNGAKKAKPRCDSHTTKLMADLLGGAVAYARTTIQGGTVPALAALNEGRDLLQSAKKRLLKVGDDVQDQVKDKDLKQITYALYSRIPKVKPLNVGEDAWILSSANIGVWEQDIDAFETALNAGDFEAEEDTADPMQGMPIDMEYIDLKSELGQYIANWWKGASRNRHHGMGDLKVRNLWRVERHGVKTTFDKNQKTIAGEMGGFNNERPLHQDKKRFDLDTDKRRVYWDTNTALVFHGTRSVNVAGILREDFRFPKELVGVQINGAAFGPGTYFADDWKKSAGYCSDPRSYWAGGGMVKNRKSFMFACDVVMGTPHVVTNGYGFTSPPKGCHSVFGKGSVAGGSGFLQNNEWIVYTKGRSQIRYLAEIEW